MINFRQLLSTPAQRRSLTDIVSMRKNLKDLLSNRYTKSEIPAVVTRSMPDSSSEAVIPLMDEKARDKYLTAHKGVRFGRLLEDLDTFAVHISYKHNEPLRDVENNTHPLGIVTALVDDVEIRDQNLSPTSDILLKGQVSWTGRSSMEIEMKVVQDDVTFLDASFVMVARHPTEPRAAQVCPLQAQTAKERRTFAQAELRKAKRVHASKMNLFRQPPTDDEAFSIHQMFISSLDPAVSTFSARTLKPNEMWMHDCKLKSALAAMPEYRNIHGKLFGGHIMRKAFELAWANIGIVSKQVMVAVGMDDIDFRNPVEIGSIFLMNSQVAYTKDDMAVVRVYAEVAKPVEGTVQTTNTFYFKFKSLSGDALPAVVPKTYGESLLFIDGQRRI